MRTDSAYFKTFMTRNWPPTASSDRLIRWQQFLSWYPFSVQIIKGKDNSLPDSLTREMASMNLQTPPEMVKRKVGRPRKVPEKQLERIPSVLSRNEKSLGENNKGKGIASEQSRQTEFSQGNAKPSPKQTALGKDFSKPLKAAGLLKTPTGEIDIEGFTLPYFSEPVFKTHLTRMGIPALTLVNNLYQNFLLHDKKDMEVTLKVLCKYLARNSNPAPANYAILSDQDSQISDQDMTSVNWSNFYEMLRTNTLGRLNAYMQVVPGYFPGHYLVDVKRDCPQDTKIWLFENGFIRNLYVEYLEDLEGLPLVLKDTYKNYAYSFSNSHGRIIRRIKCFMIPPEWFIDNGVTHYYPSFMYCKLMSTDPPNIPIKFNLTPAGSTYTRAHMIIKVRGIMEADCHSAHLLVSTQRMVICSEWIPMLQATSLFKGLTALDPNNIPMSDSCFHYFNFPDYHETCEDEEISQVTMPEHLKETMLPPEGHCPDPLCKPFDLCERCRDEEDIALVELYEHLHVHSGELCSSSSKSSNSTTDAVTVTAESSHQSASQLDHPVPASSEYKSDLARLTRQTKLDHTVPVCPSIGQTTTTVMPHMTCISQRPSFRKLEMKIQNLPPLPPEISPSPERTVQFGTAPPVLIEEEEFVYFPLNPDRLSNHFDFAPRDEDDIFDDVAEFNINNMMES